MTSPIKSNVALRYLASINDSGVDTPNRLPLQPTLKYNLTPSRTKKDQTDEQDLDKLAKQLNINPTTSPSKTALLRSRFESPSVTVSSFKSPLSKSNTSATSSRSGSPVRRTPLDGDEGKTIASAFRKDAFDLSSTKGHLETPLSFKDNNKLSPLKQQINTPSPSHTPFLSSPSNNTSKDSPGYEYLCRIMALKNWLETVLQESITQKPAELISYIRNGIHLAKLANVILNSQKTVFTNDSKLQFRHTENINRFFQLLDYLNVPDLFRFELTDLYDAKNVPKVWFCLHAMSYMLNKMEPSYPQVENLVHRVDFSGEEIRTANRALVGAGLPNFSSADTSDSSPLKAGQSSYMNRALASSNKLQPLKGFKAEKKIDNENPFMERSVANDDHLVKPTNSSYSPLKKNVEHYNSSRPSTLNFHSSTLSYDIDYKSSKYYTPEVEEHIENVKKLQALARGANFRYRMFVDRIMLKSFGDELTYFVSIMRGNMSRNKTVHKHRDELLMYKYELVKLQSIIRGRLSKSSNNYDFSGCGNSSINLQSTIRGYLERKRFNTVKSAVLGSTSSVIDLQSVMKAKLIRPKATVLMKHKDSIEPSILGFQAICRGCLFKRYSKSSRIQSLSNGGGMVKLQSLIRGQVIRNDIHRKRNIISRSLSNLCDLQSIARGGISRTRLCNNVLITLIYEDSVLNTLYARVRGNNARKEIQRKKDILKENESRTILPIQSIFRGILCRFQREIRLEDLYFDIDNIIDLQSIIRGKAIRNEITSIETYYHINSDKVIRAQAIIKSNFTQRAYKSLINMKNPPLAVIQRFAYLLTDNDMDYQEEMELSDMKDKIIGKSKNNEDLELQIEKSDIKLSLLDKNKITVEEFIKHKNKYKTYKPAANNAVNLQNLAKLNKSSRERIDLYQTMFYFLQTKPVYFIRLYNSMPIASKDSKFNKDLQYYITLMFPIKDSSINHNSREEFFLVKFISSMMNNDMEYNCRTISDITKCQECFWIDYLLQFNNHTYQRLHLKGIMGKSISHIIDNDELDFESDPSEIYSDVIKREIKINGSSDKPEHVTSQVAIKNTDVSDRFVKNLMHLREFSTEVFNVLEKSIERIPIHIRLLSNNAYRLSQVHFPEKSEQQHLAVAGVVFIKHYISAILQYPENFGYLAKSPFNASLYNAKAKDNLKHLSRVMLQVFSMKPFSDNYLKPLNDYVISMNGMIKKMVSRLIDVKSIEDEYELNDYDDIVTHERPKLSMKVSDMIMIEKIVSQNVDVMAPSSDDQLCDITSKLEDVINSADDFVTLTELGIVTLNLNPTTKEDSLADSKVLSLISQAKRCILYIIRIQEGSGLLELLISGIKPQHEAKFKEIVSVERKEIEEASTNVKKRPYYKTSLGNLSSLTYHELKKMALEIILKLESMGVLTRKNAFQEILNQIAIDIKTKHSQRVNRKAQLEIASKTQKKLLDKEKFLTKQLFDYNQHIDNVLSELQLKSKDKKLFNIIPVFSKQYFYHRELKKSNRLPKFGSYKYSAKKLIDQEILIDFGGLMSQRYSSSSKLDFMFSCHEVGKFTIEAATGSVNIPGAYNSVTIDQLLNLQYENKEKFELFDGMVIFDTHNLTGFIFRKFYDLRRD